MNLTYLQIPFKMPNYNVGWLFLCICVIGNALAIDLTRLYGLHNKRETSIGKSNIRRNFSIFLVKCICFTKFHLQSIQIVIENIIPIS